MSDSAKGLVTAAAGSTAVELAGSTDDGGHAETRRTVRLRDILVHPMDVSVPIERQVNVYSAMAAGSAAHGLPPVRVGYWVDYSDVADGGGSTGAKNGSTAGQRPGPNAGRSGRPGTVGADGLRELEEYVPKKYYLLADGDLYRGYVRAGAVKAVECTVVKCDGEADFLARHALANQRPTGYDPLRLGRVVRHLQAVSRGGAAQDGTGRTISHAEAVDARRAVEDVMRSCRDTVDQKFINLHLDEEASKILSEMCTWLGGKLSRFEMPYYIPYAVSRVPPGVQAELAEQISLIVRGGPITDAKFAWPAPEELSVLADTPTFRGEPGAALDGGGDNSKGRGVTVAVPEGRAPAAGSPRGNDDNSRTGSTGTAASQAASAPAPAAKAGTDVPRAGRADSVLLQHTRDAVVIPRMKTNPAYLVDVRTRRVSEVDEHEKITVLREVGDASTRKGAYLMPVTACEWLGLPGTAAAMADPSRHASGGAENGSGGATGDEGAVRLFTFDTPSQLAKFLQRQERELEKMRKKGQAAKTRGVIIYR
ncbi:MAG: hypothetical protein OXK17_01915 [Thaumarchaeota archaeon]|nr:hypothetical protein [Nitrososphaerota archaeon]